MQLRVDVTRFASQLITCIKTDRVQYARINSANVETSEVLALLTEPLTNRTYD